ncbi:MAG: rhomboid family intramembrane serine protease [Natrialbaceae archaeon]|nr:rhomboid family intramembrane serine protease [Natrialbaceae archaeon]
MARSPIIQTLVAFAVVFTLQVAASVINGEELYRVLFILSLPLEVNAWTLVTSVYAHAGADHLVWNAIALILFGWPVARATSRMKFHAFFIATGAIAGAAQLLVPVYLPVEVSASGVLGASGAVFAVMGYLLSGNRVSAGLADRLEVPFWVAVVLSALLAVAITWATASPRAALIAHFTGLLLGLVAGRLRIL